MTSLGKTWTLSEESRRRISVAKSGKPLSAKHRAKIAAGGTGRKHSEATKQKIREARLQNGTSPAQAAHLAKLNGPDRITRRWSAVGSYAVYGPTLRERDGDLCQLCLSLIDFEAPLRTPYSRTVDHVVPVTRGGPDTLDNMWLAHLTCNQKKGCRYIGRPDGTTNIRSTS
jgi:5-methylcytosine-specific restriction endonuclease McrA